MDYFDGGDAIRPAEQGDTAAFSAEIDGYSRGFRHKNESMALVARRFERMQQVSARCAR
jgi:hypothetical protein